MSQPELKAKLATARAQLLEGATSAIQARVGEAVETMTNIMHDEKASAQTRLNASGEILRNALRMGEMLDVVKRVADLERAIIEIEGDKR